MALADYSGMDQPQRPTRIGVKHRITPRLLAFGFYHLTLILYAIRPGWSYQFNVDLEDHAEREYMTFVLETPGPGARAIHKRVRKRLWFPSHHGRCNPPDRRR